MKLFLSFIRKEIFHIVRDVRTLTILLVIPVVLMILFGYAITTEVKDTRVAVLDLSKDNITRQIVERFAANKYFTITKEVATMDEIDATFRRSEIDMALCFSDNFASEALHDGSSIQLLFDGIEPNQASIRSGYAQQLLAAAMQELSTGRGASARMPTGCTGRVTIVPNVRMLYNPQQKSEYNFVPGVMGMIVMLLCTLMTSVAIVREKEVGTMEVLLASPLPPVYIILAKLVPYFVISFVNMLTILALSKWMLGLPFVGNLALWLAIAALFILVALSIGILISTCVSSQLAAMLLSLLMIVPTLYFSGMVFSVEAMPAAAQGIATIIPARWFIDATRKLMIQGVEPVFVVKDTVILVIELVVLLAISLKLFKVRLS